MKHLPRLSTAQIWNMSIGFLGIQFGFAFKCQRQQNSAKFWGRCGAPVVVLVGCTYHRYDCSAHCWPLQRPYLDTLGRRRPYFLFGAIFAALH